MKNFGGEGTSYRVRNGYLENGRGWFMAFFGYFFHVFKWWDIIALLPVTLAQTFMVYRLKNTTPGLPVHLTFYGMGILGVPAGVLG